MAATTQQHNVLKDESACWVVFPSDDVMAFIHALAVSVNSPTSLASAFISSPETLQASIPFCRTKELPSFICDAAAPRWIACFTFRRS